VVKAVHAPFVFGHTLAFGLIGVVQLSDTTHSGAIDSTDAA